MNSLEIEVMDNLLYISEDKSPTALSINHGLEKKNTVLNVPFVQLDTQTDSSDKTFYDKIFQPVSILAEMLPEFYQENRLFNSNAECLCFCAVDW